MEINGPVWGIFLVKVVSMGLKWCVRLTPQSPVLFLTPCVEPTRDKYDQLKPLQESVGSLLALAISEADQD